MKDSIYAVMLGAIALLSACDGGKTEQPAPNLPPTGKMETNNAQTRCFSLMEGKDLTAVQLQQDGNAISGYFIWEPFEKDGAHGVLNGEINDGLIKASHTYMIEGSIQMEETYFKLEGDQLLQGTGDLVNDNGILVVKDPTSLQFTAPMDETDCSNLQQSISNAEQIAAAIEEQGGNNGLDLGMLGENLVGDWQSTQDPKARLSINESAYSNIYDGKPLDSSPYEVLASCPESCGQAIAEMPCLQLKGQDAMCYSILNADGETLELSLVSGTGNTNQYQRINAAAQQP
ncbi:MAG: hypothetical protein R3E93_15180 [Thiothrix sp.]